jgi:hypothetical protein
MGAIIDEPIILNGVDLEGDLSTLSDIELWRFLDDAWRNVTMHMSMQITVKTCRNSMYGATSNKHYKFANIDVAEDITAEGRFYIKQGEHLTNQYFNFEWHTDSELHQMMFNDPVLKDGFITPNIKVGQLAEKDRVIYIDTDSMYIDYEDVIRSIGFLGKSVIDANKSTIDSLLERCANDDADAIAELDNLRLTAEVSDYHEFIVRLHQYRMTPYYNEGLAKIVAERHGNSVLEFDVETIADTAIFLAKKQYVQTLKWQDGRTYDNPISHIKAKGVELIKSSASWLVRNMLNYAYQKILSRQVYDIPTYKVMMRNLWNRFESEQDIQLLCMYTNCDKYFNYIENDTTNVSWKSGTLPQYRGAATYNWLIGQLGHETRYERLENGRVYWYIVDRAHISIQAPFYIDAFAFIPGELPEDMSKLLPLDRMAMFYKMVQKPIERLANAVNIYCENPLSTSFVAPLI